MRLRGGKPHKHRSVGDTHEPTSVGESREGQRMTDHKHKGRPVRQQPSQEATAGTIRPSETELAEAEIQESIDEGYGVTNWSVAS